MDILTYIMAISITAFSVFKTAELFHISDEKLNGIRKDFEQKTKNLHQNQKGSVTFFAILFLFIISALLYLYVAKMQIEYKESVYRKDSYLCFHYLNTKTESYVSDLAKFNNLIRAAFLAKNTVVNGVSGEVIFKGLVIARNARHFYYLKQLAVNDYCKMEESLSYLKSLPFSTIAAGKLDTNFDETTKVRSKQWAAVIYKRPLGIRTKKSFCLKTNFQIEGAFFPNLKSHSEEIPAAGMSSLKCLSGFQSS
jgi:hypothetical protein